MDRLYAMHQYRINKQRESRSKPRNSWLEGLLMVSAFLCLLAILDALGAVFG